MNTSLSPVFGVPTNPSMMDFPGRMAAMMFLAGCNFRCGFCHNAALLGEPKPGMPWDSLRDCCLRFRRDWIDAVVLTGGEPTLSPELPELVDFLKRMGFALKLDTNGSRPEVLEALLPQLDYVAMDVKCSLPHYSEMVGFDDDEAVARSIDLIRSRARAYEFRTTVVPTLHSDAEMMEVGELVRGSRLFVLQPFVPRDSVLDQALRRLSRTPDDRLLNLQEMLAGCAETVEVRGG